MILFYQVAQKLFPDFALACFNLLRHKAIMIGPKILEANGVKVQKVLAGYLHKYEWNHCVPFKRLSMRLDQ